MLNRRLQQRRQDLIDFIAIILRRIVDLELLQQQQRFQRRFANRRVFLKERLDVLRQRLEIANLLRELLGLLFHLRDELGFLFAAFVALRAVSIEVQNVAFFQRGERFEVVDELDGSEGGRRENLKANGAAVDFGESEFRAHRFLLCFASCVVREYHGRSGLAGWTELFLLLQQLLDRLESSSNWK